MKSTTMLMTALSAASLVYSHGLPVTLSVSGGKSYELYDPFTDPYIPEISRRPARTSWTTPGNGPVEDVTLRDIACNGDTAAGFTSKAGSIYATAAAGDKVSIKWDRWPSDHKGPIMTYMASCGGDCRSADPTTLDWFKISHAGLHADGLKWATDDLIANDLTSDTTIPADIKAGNYLLRHEILALHSASEVNGAQFYPVCVNMKITGGGSAAPSDTVKFPGAYKATDPGVDFDIWWPIPLVEKYVIPGPAPYVAGDSTPAPATTSKAATTKAASTKAAPETTAAASELSSAPEASVAPAATTVEPESPGYGYGSPSVDSSVEPVSTAEPIETAVEPVPSPDGTVTSTYIQTIIQTAVVTMTKVVAETHTVTVTPEGSVCTQVGRYRRDVFNW
ncbi:glycosyl hydrolase family 61-domain-containing protein [Geopyxis carbonaria]|nr:glycosyl hydrolase family 61-domain-containing protein [Geopyxis carbonaria]